MWKATAKKEFLHYFFINGTGNTFSESKKQILNVITNINMIFPLSFKQKDRLERNLATFSYKTLNIFRILKNRWLISLPWSVSTILRHVTCSNLLELLIVVLDIHMHIRLIAVISIVCKCSVVKAKIKV